jgi:hypothetical protein
MRNPAIGTRGPENGSKKAVTENEWESCIGFVGHGNTGFSQSDGNFYMKDTKDAITDILSTGKGKFIIYLAKLV